jgi:hypothetical protein
MLMSDQMGVKEVSDQIGITEAPAGGSRFSPPIAAGSAAAQRFLSLVALKLEVPVAEIVVHLGVTVLSVLSIAFIEGMLRAVGLDGKKIPWTEITLSDWMFYLEVIAATAIIAIGVFKAAMAAWRAP